MFCAFSRLEKQTKKKKNKAGYYPYKHHLHEAQKAIILFLLQNKLTNSPLTVAYGEIEVRARDFWTRYYSACVPQPIGTRCNTFILF